MDFSNAVCLFLLLLLAILAALGVGVRVAALGLHGGLTGDLLLQRLGIGLALGQRVASRGVLGALGLPSLGALYVRRIVASQEQSEIVSHHSFPGFQAALKSAPDATMTRLVSRLQLYAPPGPHRADCHVTSRPTSRCSAPEGPAVSRRNCEMALRTLDPERTSLDWPKYANL
jgi:hypothetical protein